MKAIWAALKDTVLMAIVKINFTDLIFGALTGLTGFWGKIISLFARPVVSRIESKIDEQIQASHDQAISDQKIGEQAKSNVTKIEQAKTDEEIDEAFRDSLR